MVAQHQDMFFKEAAGSVLGQMWIHGKESGATLCLSPEQHVQPDAECHSGPQETQPGSSGFVGNMSVQHLYEARDLHCQIKVSTKAPFTFCISMRLLQIPPLLPSLSCHQNAVNSYF